MSSLLHQMINYDPDKHARRKLGGKRSTKRTGARGGQLPKDVRPNPNTSWLERTEINGQDISWTNLITNGAVLLDGRTPILLEEERDYLEETKGMLLEKGQELKFWWAAGDSIGKCAKRYRGARGYGYNTIKKYWALYNRASSPTETIGEGFQEGYGNLW